MLNTTLKNNPALMETIINIQTMAEIVGQDISFKYLETKKYSVLMEIQDNLIPLYNDRIEKNKFANDMIFKKT